MLSAKLHLKLRNKKLKKTSKNDSSYSLKNEFGIFQENLPTGLGLIHQEWPYSEVAHCGVLIKTGSRDENEGEEGYAHFLEHMFFKGTHKRKPYHILNRIDSVGGEINAYTSKEETFIHCSFLTSHFSRAVELLADIIYNSVLPEREILKEKEVILDEIDSYKDSPSEQIFDDFESLIFRDNTLGKQILGTKKSVRAAGRAKLNHFYQKNYNNDRLIFSSVANISSKKVRETVMKFFDRTSASNSDENRKPFVEMPVFNEIKRKDVFQCHSLIGAYAYAATDERRRVLSLITNLLGGPTLNNRLNMNIREKYGLTYNLEAHYTPYSDTGLFQIYFGTDARGYEKSSALIYRELSKLRDNRLGVLQLHQAKQQFIGQIALANESKLGLMQSLGKSMANFEKVDTLQEVYESIRSITSEEILEICNELFEEKKLSQLSFVPRKMT